MSATTTLAARNRANSQHSTGPRTDEGKARSSRNALTHGIFCKNLLLPNEDPMPLAEFKRGMLASLNPHNAIELELVEQIISDQWRIKRVRAAERDTYRRWIEACRVQHDKKMREEYPDLQSMLIFESSIAKAADPNSNWAKRYPHYHQEYLKLVAKAQENLRLRRPFEAPTAGELLADMMACDDPELQRLHRYEHRLSSSVHRCLNQLRKLQKEPPPDQSELTQAMLEQEDAPTDADVQNEARETSDACCVMRDEGKNDSSSHVSRTTHQSASISGTTQHLNTLAEPVEKGAAAAGSARIETTIVGLGVEVQ